MPIEAADMMEALFHALKIIAASDAPGRQRIANARYDAERLCSGDRSGCRQRPTEHLGMP